MSVRWRLAALVVGAVLLQGAVFPSLRVLDVVPDVGLVVALAVAVTAGPAAGGVVGFATGLGYDLFLETPLGLSALAWTVTAYGAGVLWGGLIRPPRWVAPWLGGAGGLAAGLLFVAVGIIFGADVLTRWEVVGVVARVAAYDAVLAVPAFWVVGRSLRTVERADLGSW